MITVVNKHTHKPTKNDVYIGRGSPLGNPFTGSKELNKTKAVYQSNSREESIESYHTYLLDKIKNKDENICKQLNEIYKKAKHDDINLVCFCAPLSCHGNIIKKIIEEKLLSY